MFSSLKIFVFSFLFSLTAITFSLAEDILRLQIAGDFNGHIEIKLRSDLAPLHAERIRLLANQGKYDGVVFHRVIDGFMAQTGDVKFGNIKNFDPMMVGMGGSDYPNLPAEFSKIPFEKGVVGMARSRSLDSGNSQFFIMLEAASHLNEKYSVIGKVIKGLDAFAGIKKGDPKLNGKVTNPDYIEKAIILNK